MERLKSLIIWTYTNDEVPPFDGIFFVTNKHDIGLSAWSSKYQRFTPISDEICIKPVVAWASEAYISEEEE